MSTIVILTCAMMVVGAGVMLVSIVKSRSVHRELHRLDIQGMKIIDRYFMVHQALMGFFFIGYLVVIYSVIMRLDIIGEFFVGMIFFFGAVFVLLGIFLNSKMLEKIASAYWDLVGLLKEKDVLMKEIHHRVKNNLQLISSLLTLQSRQTGDEKTRELLMSSQSRVRSMAMVHEKLYRTENFSAIDLPGYVDSLVDGLVKSFGPTAEKIDVRMNIAELNIGIDIIIPFGIIFNELFTNALKYAFPPEWEGRPEIRVTVHEIQEGKVELRFEDNGIGLTEDIDIETTDTLGIKLITILTKEQLDGEISVDRDHGTKYTLRFRTKEESSHP